MRRPATLLTALILAVTLWAAPASAHTVHTWSRAEQVHYHYVGHLQHQQWYVRRTGSRPSASGLVCTYHVRVVQPWYYRLNHGWQHYQFTTSRLCAGYR